MKKALLYIILIISFSCSNKQEEPNATLDGIWKSESGFLLVLDSVMTHPYYDFPGFYQYTINNDTLVVLGNEKTQFYKDSFLKLKSRNDKAFELIVENNTLHFSKVDPAKSVRKIKELTFESGFGEGRMPIFKLTLSHTGKAVYEGEDFSSVIGRKEYQLDTAFISQLNQLLHHIEIDLSTKNDLLPLPGSPRQDLHIKYMNGQNTTINRGLFDGLDYILVKVFWHFDTLLE